MNFAFLLIFCTGVAVLLADRGSFKPDLRSRVLAQTEKIKGRAEKTALVKAVKRGMSERRKEKMLAELAACLSYVNSLVIVGREQKLNAEMLLEELADFSHILSPAFIDMSYSLNVNDAAKAETALFELIGDSAALDVGKFIANWDTLDPADVFDTLSVYRDALRTQLDVAKRRRDELISDLVYFPAVAGCMAVLMNFIYIAFFIEQKEALAALF